MAINSHNTDDTRTQLLQAAYCEIHRHGFQGAGIAQILAQTGLTKGALYHHFPNKHALGLAVIDEIIAPQLDRLLLAPLRESATPYQTLLELTSNVAHTIGEESILLGCPLNNLMQEMSPLDEVFRLHLDSILSAWRSVLQQALLSSQQQGYIRQDIDCTAAALFILSAWEGCIGVAKTMKSVDMFNICMLELHRYVLNLG